MNKKLSAAEVLKEAAILTAAVAIIAAAVYFFLVPSAAFPALASCCQISCRCRCRRSR